MVALATSSPKRSALMPERADHARGAGYAELGLQLLGRRAGAGEDAARDRRAAQSPRSDPGRSRPKSPRRSASSAATRSPAHGQGVRRPDRAASSARTPGSSRRPASRPTKPWLPLPRPGLRLRATTRRRQHARLRSPASGLMSLAAFAQSFPVQADPDVVPFPGGRHHRHRRAPGGPARCSETLASRC